MFRLGTPARALGICLSIAIAPAAAGFVTPASAATVTVGEIVVMEADVSGTDGISITPGNIDAIVQAFYAEYPTEFDMISIWTTFSDAANGGAYFMGNPGSFPSRQLGFINMNAVGFWTGFEALNTLGQ